MPVAGASAALLVILSLLTLAWWELGEREDDARRRNLLVARVFAETVTRNVDSAALALTNLGELLRQGASPDSVQVGASMAQTLVNLPFVRGISVVRADGRILASTDLAAADLNIELARLGQRPRPDSDQLGEFIALRRLADLRDAGAAAPPGVGFLPLVRHVSVAGRPPVFLVASLNAEAFVNFQQTALNDEQSASALLSYDGRLIAATGQTTPPAGTDFRALAPFSEFLPSKEHGAWIGAGLRPGEQVGAFMTSSSRPLVLLVETERASLIEAWREQVRPLALAGAAAVLLIGVMTITASLSQRARRAAQRERDAAQAVVVRRERELAVTLESLQELVFRTDAQGRIGLVNERFGLLTAGRPGLALGRSLWSLVHADSQAAVRALFDPEDASGLRRTEAEAGDPHGRPHQFEITVMPLRDRGRVVGFAGSAFDVTQSREAARAIAQARDEAEAASRAKTEFIANISHELRTPLQAIIGFSELGQHRSREHPRLTALFGDVLRAGHRMLSLVNDLLDVSRIDSTIGAIHLERADLRPLVREVIDELRPLSDRRDLSLVLVLPEQAMVAKVDPLRFQQVVRNVAANAIKFAPPGSAVELRGEIDAEGLQLTVSDRGPGIPEGEIEAIFEAFVQSSTTKDGSGGTGLGLAICRKIMAVFGGHIHAENRAGGGAVFHLRLPARAPRDTEPMPL